MKSLWPGWLNGNSVGAARNTWRPGVWEAWGPAAQSSSGGTLGSMTVVEDDPVQRRFRSAAAATAGPSPEARRYLDDR